MVLIFIIVLMLFGGQKLPEFARGLGKTIREFKKAAAGVEEEFKRALDDDERKRIAAATPVVPAVTATDGKSTDPTSSEHDYNYHDSYGDSGEDQSGENVATTMPTDTDATAVAPPPTGSTDPVTSANTNSGETSPKAIAESAAPDFAGPGVDSADPGVKASPPAPEPPAATVASADVPDAAGATDPAIKRTLPPVPPTPGTPPANAS